MMVHKQVQTDLVGGGDRERDLESLSLAATSRRCCLISTVDGGATAGTAACPVDRSTGFTGAASSSDDDDDEELE